MVTFARLGSESPNTSQRQLLGINLPRGRQHDGFMGNDERMRAQPWVDAATPPTPSSDLRAERGVGGYRRTTSFRTRRSQLSAAQQRTWERLWPELGYVATSGHDPQAPAEPLDTHAWFGRDAPLVLEIGCGTGTSTLAMAKSEPDVDVIAIEVYRRGLAQLLAPGSLSGVRVFFPDPWPKARHHKRRLLQPETVATIADRLRPGGVLHAATDHAGYAEQIAEVGDAEPRLTRLDAHADTPISVVRPVTKYEGKAHVAGSAVTEFLWESRSERTRP